MVSNFGRACMHRITQAARYLQTDVGVAIVSTYPLPRGVGTKGERMSQEPVNLIGLQARHRPDDIKRDVLNRLKSVAGHVKGITRMVDEDAYCIDVIHQIQAVQAALNKVSIALLDDHMHHCVSDAIRSGDESEHERVIEELKDVFETLSKL